MILLIRFLPFTLCRKIADRRTSIWLGLKKRNTSPNSSVHDGDFYWLYDGSPYTFQAHQWSNTKYTSHVDACIVVIIKTKKWQFDTCYHLSAYLCKKGMIPLTEENLNENSLSYL